MSTRIPITLPSRVTEPGGVGAHPQLVTPLGGVLGTLALVYVVGARGLGVEAGAIFGTTIFVAVVAGFVYVPWITVAAVIPLYALLPTLRLFVHPALGGLKDLVSIAAVTAAGVLLLQRRVSRRNITLDVPLVVLIGLVVLLYVMNLGGNFSGETRHGAAWFHGVRLVCQPLLLLFVGLVLRDPRRTFRAAAVSVIATAVGVGVYGLFQQVLGENGLIGLGYSYGRHVRTLDGYLRSFGTLDDPFLYASFLLIALAVGLMWAPRRRLTNLAVALIAFGIVVSYVRTAAVIAVALLGLTLARYGHRFVAALLVTMSAIAAVTVLIVASQQSATRTVSLTPSTYLTLNGRTELWQEQLGSSPTGWLLGRGVGATGTAADRANRSLGGKRKLNATEEKVVDSGYLAVMADVGLVGLALILALSSRLLLLGWQIGRTGDIRGWGAVGVTAVVMLDALSRESFTGFPVAYVGMLLIGLGVATGDGRGARASHRRRAPA